MRRGVALSMPMTPSMKIGRSSSRVVEAVEGRVELRMGRLGRNLQRIEVGFEMADHAVGTHQLNGADRFLGGGAQILVAGRQRLWALPIVP